ncbi:DegT/DnrJ/EryC1/StrS family aminotransferase [bacterium]|nr:DegT/DnrJ/EryC1/StrS family aminotransferase [bacterium]
MNSKTNPQLVPFLDLKAAYQELKGDFDLAYSRVMERGHFIMGPELEAFEREFADYCGTRFALGVGNGLDALTLLLKAINIQPGDEVLVPVHTFIATWLAVSSLGGVPVPVPIKQSTYNLDPAQIVKSISKKTKAIIPVHLYGQPVEMSEILDIAKKNKLKVIEDAAQAHGARYSGKRVGTFGDAAAFSFYPGKNLGCFGDGGAVVTNDDEIHHRVKMIRNYGSVKRYHHDVLGINSRLDELQAAFLRARLRHLDEWNTRRQQIARHYQDQLSQTAGLKLPQEEDKCESVWHLFVVEHPQRDQLQSHLMDQGIQTLIHYPLPPHLSGAYSAQVHGESSFGEVEAMCNRLLSLPIGPQMTPQQIDRVVSSVQSFR